MNHRISSSAFADTKPHYELLDGLRGVAALLVVFYHIFEGFSFAGGGTLITVINHGYLAVDFFFILSGFVIGYAYDDRWKKNLTLKGFFKRRLIRLHPMIIMGAIIGCIAFFVQGGVKWDGTHVATSAVMLALLLAMCFIPAYPGAGYDVRGNGEMFSLNGPSWSLFFEYIGNILYALFIHRLSNKALTVLVILLGLGLSWFASLQGQKETAWKFDKEPESFTQLKTKGQVCLGWHQVTNETSSGQLPSLIQSAKAMNVISPTWYALSDNTGKFGSLANSSYVAQAHAQGKQVWGLINDFGKGIKLSKVLGVTSNRNRLVNGLVATAIQHELDGINIDFEHVTKDTAPAYLEFLRELTLKCHANDLIVSVDNYSPASYNAYYDLEEQGRIVDYVILMAYDEHYNGSEESGSVSSLPFVKEGVKNVLAKVPAERTVVALPFYTRLWKEVKGKKPHPEAYGMSGAESVVRANDASPKWDEATGQYYAEFKSSGATYKIWLEEETSLKKKLEVVKKSKTAGVAFWKLGFERAVTWTTIADAVRGW